jgi:hypothetical protein
MKRSVLAALLAAVLSLDAGVAGAGAVLLSYDEQVETLREVHQRLAESVDLDLSPILEPGAGSTAPGQCAAGTPAVHGLLIGTRDSIGPSFVGPENDVGLLSAALMARTGDAAHIVALTGADVSRERLGAAFSALVDSVQCGDRVFLHFGGMSLPGRELLIELGLDRTATARAVDSDFAIENFEAGEDILRLRRTPFLLVLNRNAGGRLELVSGSDLTDFVTRIRNLGADIVVSLDSPFADRAAIADGQHAAGDGLLWSLQSLDRGAPPPPAVTLTPPYGDFVAIYGSVGNWASVDKSFPNPDAEGGTTTYGAFTFEFAKLLQDPGAVTARLLGERIAAIPAELRARDGTYLVEGSNPQMTLFDRTPLLELAEAAIQLNSPTPMRGPQAVESAVIEVSGVVNWPSPPVGVMVQGKLVDLDSQGRFRGEAQLSAGVNSIEVVALTRESRLLQRSVDVVYGGDVGALRDTGRNYLVTIANEAYGPGTGFAPLATPIADAEALRALLVAEYGYADTATLPDGSTLELSLRNASGRDIAMTLYRIGLAATAADTVLIYYAGHGIYEPLTTTAFWVPVDAEAGVPVTYLSASSISEAIARIQARKVVLISDSCFSGALLRGGGAEGETIDETQRVNSLLALARGKTRLLISSGNNEPVTDGGGSGHSIFARALLDGLSAMEPDQFSARELFDQRILQRVLANSQQEPQFRPLENVGHEGGDLVFVRASAG